MAKAIALDLWVCSHFHVLPTEEKFLKLSEKQKVLLFFGFAEMPTDVQLHEAYAKEQEGPSVSEEDEKNFASLGYSGEQIERMKENLSQVGL